MDAVKSLGCIEPGTFLGDFQHPQWNHKPSKSTWCGVTRTEMIHLSRFYFWTPVRTIVTFIKCVLTETTAITADLCTVYCVFSVAWYTVH